MKVRTGVLLVMTTHSSSQRRGEIGGEKEGGKRDESDVLDSKLEFNKTPYEFNYCDPMIRDLAPISPLPFKYSANTANPIVTG